MQYNIPSITRDSHNSRLVDRHTMDLPISPFYRREPRPNMQHCRQMKRGEHTVDPAHTPPVNVRGRSEGCDVPEHGFRVVTQQRHSQPCEDKLQWNENTKRRFHM